VTLDTLEGPVRYAFPADLTILAGPTGVGKTTLLESIKYGFGGDGVLADVILDNVNDVSVDVTIGESRYLLVRSVDQSKRRTVRVTDLRTQDRLPDHSTDLDRAPSLNTLLMSALGFPDDMKAAARTGTSTNVGARISFADIFLFLYIAQSDMNRDIAKSQDSYYESKRKAVFELLFGLTDKQILALRSRVNQLNSDVAAAEKETKTIRGFLRDSNTTSKAETLNAFSEAVDEQMAAETALRALRQQISPVTDRETQVLRDLLNEAERRLAETKATATTLIRQHKEFSNEKRRVQADLARLQRMRDAGDRLANIEFVSCPRCMQSLTTRPVPDGACRVCLQHDPVTDSQDQAQYEERQLTSQLQEMDDQLTLIADQLVHANEAAADRESLVKRLTAEIESRTSERVTPRLQAFTDASQRLANAKARQRELETVLRQWDRVDDIVAAEDTLRAERDRIRAEHTRREKDIDERRRAILGELDVEFGRAIRSMGVPSIKTTKIHPTNYLPLLNGKPFHRASKGGGIITATQIAYWTSILYVVVSRGDTYYPSFLLIDSPRMALNTAEDLTAALYRRLRNLAGALPGKMQLIVADNQLPPTLQADFAEVDFDYDHPTVATVPHPGPAEVETIYNDEEE
jgi:hypothetical protein